MKTEAMTPLMRQYYGIKQQFPDALVLFQVGDFYELFFEDAQRAAIFLGITLTKRGLYGDVPIPLCGVPVHTIDHYLIKLVRGGFRVVVCNQKGVAQTGKMVEREVSQVLTPGTLTDIKLLNEKTASYLSIVFPTEQQYALIFVELLAGQMFLTLTSKDEEKLCEAELSRFLPDEVVVPDSKVGLTTEKMLKKWGYVTTQHPFLSVTTLESTEFNDWLTSFTSSSLEFVRQSVAAQEALYVLFTYLKKNQERALAHCKQLQVYSPEDFLILDAATQRNLELVKNVHDGSSEQTVFAVLDRATTPMGSRLIKKWLVRPLAKREAIEQRLNVIESFVKAPRVRERIEQILQEVGDLERCVGRIALGRAHLYDYRALKQALETVPQIREILQQLSHGFSSISLPSLLLSRIADFSKLVMVLSQALSDDSNKDWLIKEGFHAELDRLRLLLEKGGQAIVELEHREQEKTGINSLKIRQNKVHGYGIEVTKANLDAVPPHYIRLQTLVNRERYTTNELKDLEYDLERAQTDIQEIERELFEQLCSEVAEYLPALKKLSQALAYVDALTALSNVAYTNNYTRPSFNSEGKIEITQGRHPVVDMRLGHQFIPNDTLLTRDERLWIITGPNMGGKSTYLRQVAIQAIMAQCGSFVPAQKASFSLLDRVFTRIGAGDDVAQGKSTFFVEMEETAVICTQATAQSLVILDEVGRGTSTHDGQAIAQAVLEYIYTTLKAHCLFATHYHELTALADTYSGIAAYHTASKKTQEGIVLLHRIIKGTAEGSFGIEVARQAQLPSAIVQRAQQIMRELSAA
jgi:DNA mismatch repair protein MutS